MGKLFKGLDILNQEDKNLYAQIIIFIGLPVLYLVSLFISMRAIGITIEDILETNPNECLNMILMFTSLYSGFIIYKYSKNQNKTTLASYFIVLIAQVLMRNAITLLIMIYYIYSFIGFKNIKKYFEDNIWSKDYSLILSSCLVLIVNILVFIIKIKL